MVTGAVEVVDVLFTIGLALLLCHVLVVTTLSIAAKLSTPLLALVLRRRLLNSGFATAVGVIRIHIDLMPTSLIVHLSHAEVNAQAAGFLNEYLLGLFLPSELSSMDLDDIRLCMPLWPLLRCVLLPRRADPLPMLDISIGSGRFSCRVLPHTAWASHASRDKAIATLLDAKEASLKAQIARCALPPSAATASTSYTFASIATPPPPRVPAPSWWSPSRWLSRAWRHVVSSVWSRLIGAVAVRAARLQATASGCGASIVVVHAAGLVVRPRYDGRHIDLTFEADEVHVDLDTPPPPPPASPSHSPPQAERRAAYAGERREGRDGGSPQAVERAYRHRDTRAHAPRADSDGQQRGGTTGRLTTRLLRVTPTSATTTTTASSSTSSSPTFRVHVTKRFAAADQPAELSCRVGAGALEVCLHPISTRSLVGLASAYDANCAWLAALKQHVDAGRASDAPMADEAAMGGMLAELRQLIDSSLADDNQRLAESNQRSAESNQRSTDGSRPPVIVANVPDTMLPEHMDDLRDAERRDSSPHVDRHTYLLRTLPYDAALGVIASATTMAEHGLRAGASTTRAPRARRHIYLGASASVIVPPLRSGSNAPMTPVGVSRSRSLEERLTTPPSVAPRPSTPSLGTPVLGGAGVVASAVTAGGGSSMLPPSRWSAAWSTARDMWTAATDVDQYGRAIPWRAGARPPSPFDSVRTSNGPSAAPSPAAPSIEDDAARRTAAFVEEPAVAMARGSELRRANEARMTRKLFVSVDVDEMRLRFSPSPTEACAECSASGVHVQFERPAAGAPSVETSVRRLAITDERESTRLTQRRVLGPSFVSNRPTPFAAGAMGAAAGSAGTAAEEASGSGPSADAMLALKASAANGQWRICHMSARRCALLVVTELPALVRSCVKPTPIGVDDDVVPESVLDGFPLPDEEEEDDEDDEEIGMSFAGLGPGFDGLGRGFNLNAPHTPTRTPHTASPTAAPAMSVEPPNALHGVTSIGQSLLLLGGGDWHVRISTHEVLLVLPPCRSDTAGWAVGLGLSGELRLDSAEGYERMSLRLHPRIDGSPLAPLEEAPPSWLQPARPLRVPCTPLLLPTEIHLQYATHASPNTGGGGGVGGGGTPASAPRDVSGREVMRFERLVDATFAPMALEASPSQIVASTALVRDAYARACAGGVASEPESEDSSLRGGSMFSPPGVTASRPLFSPLSAAGGGGGMGGGGAGGAGGGTESMGVSAESTWADIPQGGSLFSRHDLSHWTMRLLRKLQLVSHNRRRRQRVLDRAAGALTTATPAALPPPALTVKTEARLSCSPIALSVRAEGARGDVVTDPLFRIHCTRALAEFGLHQRRLQRSSLPSLWQLWDVDRLHGTPSVHVTDRLCRVLTHFFLGAT